MSRRLGIPESTIRSFMKRYHQTGTLNVQRGRPITITDEVRNDVVESIESQADQTLYQLSKNFSVSQTSARKILIDNSITCQRKIPVPPLTQVHKNCRVVFSTVLQTSPTLICP